MKKILCSVIFILVITMFPLNTFADSYSYGAPPTAGSYWNLEKDRDYTYVKPSNSDMKMTVHYIDGYLWVDAKAYNSVCAVFNHYGFVSTRIIGTDGKEELSFTQSYSSYVEVSLKDDKAVSSSKHAAKVKFLGRYQQLDTNNHVVNKNYLYVESGAHTETWE